MAKRRKGWLWALGALIVLVVGGAGTLWALGYLDNLALLIPAAAPGPGPLSEEPRSGAPLENVPPSAEVWVVGTTPDLPPMAL